MNDFEIIDPISKNKSGVELGTRTPENRFQKELKKIDAEIDKFYKEELEKVEPDSQVFGFEDIQDGDGSTDFTIRRQSEIIAKYAEYVGRLENDPRAANLDSGITKVSSWYQREVTRRVITEGRVNTWALSRAIVRKFDTIHPSKFNNACGVIESYIKDGGKTTFDGTGLPNFTGRI